MRLYLLIKVYVFLAVFSTVLPCLGQAEAEVSENLGMEASSEKSGISNTVSNRFIDKGDGTVLDNNTSLMWLKDADTSKMPLTWRTASNVIQEMNSGKRPNFGYKDWRVPTISDMETLVDKSQSYPALPLQHPFENIKNHFYWTATSGRDVAHYQWVMDIGSGIKAIDYVFYCNYKYLWPVRSNWADKETRPGTVLSRGLNEHGQLGDGTTENKFIFSLVKEATAIVKISAGTEHAVALDARGTVWTWGRNIEGQLGNGTTEDILVPTLVKGLWKVADVAAGKNHTLALKSDGTVWAWGRNSYGQLGTENFDDSLVPVQIQRLEDVVDIDAGMYHSIAVKSDGTVWTWGRNSYGQLGDGTTENSYLPVKAKGLDEIVGVSGGLHHSVALKSDGSVWAWGWNNNSLLGDGTKEDRHIAVRIEGLDNIKEVDVGLYHTIALTSDGSVWAWGANDYGQLGTSTTVRGSSPIIVEGLSNVRKISVGMYHSVALVSDGTAWVWGKDQKNRPKNPIPIKIRDLTNIIDATAGKYFTVVLKSVND